MNGTFFNNPAFPDDIKDESNGSILKLNMSKKVKVFTNFREPNSENMQFFSGILENSSDENLILSDPSNGSWYLIPLKFVNYIEFEEKMNH